MGGRGDAAGRTTKVRLSIKSNIKGDDMKKLNLLKNVECDVEWTWNDFFFRAANVRVNGDKYCVKSGGKDHVFMHEKVRDLIGKFKRIKSSYVVQVVETRKKVKDAHPQRATPTPTPAATATISSPSRGRPSTSRPGPNNNQQQRNSGIKRETSADSARSSSSQSSTATAPIGHSHIRIQNNNAKKPTPPGTRPIIIPPIQTPRFADREVQFPGPGRARGSLGARGGSGLPGPHVRFEEDDDNASQLTTASQESQDDLVELGIAMEDFKPKVVRRLMENISNAELLRIRHELQKLLSLNKWSKSFTRVPRTATFLHDIFRVNTE